MTIEKRKPVGANVAPTGSYFNFISGNLVTDIRTDISPATPEDVNTIIQFISDITDITPMFAIAVCATVLMARISAFITHAKIFFLFIQTII